MSGPENTHRMSRHPRVLGPLAAAGAVLLLAEGVVHPHPHFGWDGVWGFHAWVALASVVLLAAAAAGLRLLAGAPEGDGDG